MAPSAILVQSPRPGHDTVDVPTYSFLVENERAGKKVLFELGIMKAWKEKLPQCTSPSHCPYFFITTFRAIRLSCSSVLRVVSAGVKTSDADLNPPQW